MLPLIALLAPLTTTPQEPVEHEVRKPLAESRTRSRSCPLTAALSSTGSSSARAPYLLQHARNPVDWYPWGEEAFQAAIEQDKPIFLVDWLLHVSLVPRHGARVLRGRRGRGADECGLRLHQARSRGAARHRPCLHGGHTAAVGPRRLAHDGVVDPRQEALLHGHLLPEAGCRTAARHAAARPALRETVEGTARRY